MDAAFELALGQRLRALREARGLTQAQLSARMQLRGCDITRSALAKMEVGQRHIYPDELRLLRELLHTSYEALLDAPPCEQTP